MFPHNLTVSVWPYLYDAAYVVFNLTKCREVAVLLIHRKGGNKGWKTHAKLNTFPLYTAALYTNKAANGIRENKSCLPL